MIQITMTDGVIFHVSPDGAIKYPAADDAAAWSHMSKLLPALWAALDRLGGSYQPDSGAAMVKALAALPGVAAVADLDPLPPVDDPEFDEDGRPIVY